MREWTNEDLKNYVTLFSDNIRDSVLKEILEADILSRFLATSEGRLVLNSVVDDITGALATIINLSDENFDKHIEQIRQASLRIGVSYALMKRLATIALKGEEHTAEIKKRKK